MDLSNDKLLPSETILKELGFERLYHWKICGKHYFIQLCPKKNHIHILTTDMIRTIHKRGRTYCVECAGSTHPRLNERMEVIYQYEQLLAQIFQLLDDPKYHNTVLWREVHYSLLGQIEHKKYLETKNKYFCDSPSVNKDIESDNNLFNVNKHYASIIYKLNKDNQDLQDEVSVLEEIIQEQNELLDILNGFVKSKRDISDEFIQYNNRLDTSINFPINITNSGIKLRIIGKK